MQRCLLRSRGRSWALPGDPRLNQGPREWTGPSPQDPGSLPSEASSITATLPALAKVERGPAPFPAQVAFRAAQCPGHVRPLGSRCVPLHVFPRPCGPTAAPLLGIVNPAVLGGSLLPAQGQLVLAVRVVQAGVAQGCHGGRGGARSLTHSLGRQLQGLHAEELTPATVTEHRARRNPNARACALRRPESLN